MDSDLVLAAALERFIEIIGEAASRVSEAERERHPEIPWRGIIGMRNRLVHGYAAVDHEVIWDVATGDLPGLVTALQTATGE